ncbi:MAG: hypothetical protein P8176_05330 [Gammaproteobacteria bacterium]
MKSNIVSYFSNISTQTRLLKHPLLVVCLGLVLLGAFITCFIVLKQPASPPRPNPAAATPAPNLPSSTPFITADISADITAEAPSQLSTSQASTISPSDVPNTPRNDRAIEDQRNEPSLTASTAPPEPIRPRNPARETLSALFDRIHERRANPPAPYENVMGKPLSRPERLAERARLSQSNFANLCADCHSLGANNGLWAADLGAGVCQKVDCGELKALSFYINRYMPPENPSSCRGACASDMALYVFHRGNKTLAALHQETPYMMLDASITIRDSATGDVLLDYKAP